MDETIKTLVRLLADSMDRLSEAEDDSRHWQEVAGREAMRANKAQAAAMAAENRPNGSENGD